MNEEHCFRRYAVSAASIANEILNNCIASKHAKLELQQSQLEIVQKRMKNSERYKVRVTLVTCTR